MGGAEKCFIYVADANIKIKKHKKLELKTNKGWDNFLFSEKINIRRARKW